MHTDNLLWATCSFLVIFLTEMELYVDSHLVTTTNCVKTIEMNKCSDHRCTGDCKTLMQYYTNESFSSNNTRFLFYPGEHRLERFVAIRYVLNLKLAALLDDDFANVVCNRSISAGFYISNAINFTIDGIHLSDCTVQDANFSHALQLYRVVNLSMNAVTVSNTNGIGILIVKLFGISRINGTIVSYSHGERGQNFALFCHNDTTSYNNGLPSNLLISDSSFLHGHRQNSKSFQPSYYVSTSPASGIYIHITCSIQMNITLFKVKVENNTVDQNGDGGNIAIEYESYSKAWLVTIAIIKCHINLGKSILGGGLYLNAFRNLNGTYNDNKNVGAVINTTTIVDILTVNKTVFSQNSSPYLGAGVYVRLRETEWPMIAKISFNDCQFTKQRLIQSYKFGHGGVAVHIRSFQIPVYRHHAAPLFEVAFSNCTFENNRADTSLSLQPHNGGLYVQGIDSITLEHCHFLNNNCTGIVAIQSFLLLKGENIISNNKGVRGGGIVLCSRSMLQLHNGTQLNITKNTAIEYGGGIYVESECDQDIPHCFFQVDDANAHNYTLQKTKVFIQNNTALAGRAIYGGMVEHCIIYTNITAPYQPNVGFKIFKNIFHVGTKDYGENSIISSDPTSLCFCHNKTYNRSSCINNHTINAIIVPGSYVKVYVMLLGQMNSPVPGIVNAIISCNNSKCSMQQNQRIQQTLPNTAECTEIVFTVLSEHDNTTGVIILTAEGGSFQYSGTQDHPTQINLTIQKCPLGSIINEKQGVCNCLPCHKPTNITHYIYTEKSPPVWIGYRKSPVNDIPPPNTTLIIYHRFCPLGYCQEVNGRVYIRTNYSYFGQDVQCSMYRTGLLCGACKTGYSLGFGSSQCLPHCDTRDIYVRVIGLIVVCAVAGIMLVVLLTLLNLTVAEGTLNGLIFYANIVQVNLDIFFPSETHARPWIAFIAWLNLDFGFTVCFYDGMDAYAKTWLQFIFPLYIWLISGGIVYFSWKYNKVAQLTGKNAVKVLATLFLLSFGKLLRTVITAVLHTNIHSHDWNINISVWLLDANVHYLHGKHVILFITSLLVGLVVVLYALILTSIQCLRRAPNNRMCGWVLRLKPLLDAYTGPYKDKYQFWTGLLLLVRIFLFTSFSLNYENDPTVNFTLIICVCAILIAIQPGIYRHQFVGLLESSMYVNLILFSVIMMFSVGSYSKYKTIAAYVFGGWALLTFLGIITSHAYKYWFGGKGCSQFLMLWKERFSAYRHGGTAIQPLLIQRSDSHDESDDETEEEQQRLSNPTWSSTPYLREPLIGTL